MFIQLVQAERRQLPETQAAPRPQHLEQSRYPQLVAPALVEVPEVVVLPTLQEGPATLAERAGGLDQTETAGMVRLTVDLPELDMALAAVLEAVFILTAHPQTAAVVAALVLLVERLEILQAQFFKLLMR